MIRTSQLLLPILTLSASLAFAACGSKSDDDNANMGDGDGDGDGDMGGARGGDGDGDGGGDGGDTFTWVDCDGEEVDDAVQVTNTVEEDTKWSGTVRIAGNLTVRSGAALTIEPGTNLVFDADASLEVGWNGHAATLSAEGTASKPIRFCGKTARSGYWGGLIVGGNVTSDSSLKNVLIADAGGHDTALRLNGGILIENVEVLNSGADGVWAADFDKDSAGLSVEGAEGFAVVLLEGEAVDHFPPGGSFDDNQDNRIALRMTSIGTDTVFSDVKIPYLQEKTLQIREGARVEFEAGVDYQFAPDTKLEVGWNGHEAEFQVAGSEEQPVMFHGSTHTPGYWGGILIQRNVLTTSSIRHAVIADAGGQETEALRLAAKIDVRDVLLTGNETGAFIAQQGLKSSSNNLSITKTEGFPLTLEPGATLSLPEGGDFTGNDTDRIVIVGGDIEAVGTIPNPGIPYFVRAEVTTRDGSDVTLTPGTTFIMGADTRWDFGWNGGTAKITAVGTNEDPIVFVGDDESPGSWEGILIGRNVSSDSAFQHVHISHGGGGEQANLWLSQTEFDITDSVLTESATYGISTDDADTADYAADNDLSGNTLGAIDLR